jgi:hypothetical protein
MKLKQKPSRPYEEGLDERLKEPPYAIEYLNSILEENDSDLLLLGLREHWQHKCQVKTDPALWLAIQMS